MQDRTGQIIQGVYIGSLCYNGIVSNSRATYDGDTVHIVELLENLKINGTVHASIKVNEHDVFVHVGKVFEIEGELV
jgi:hypothetical protein